MLVCLVSTVVSGLVLSQARLVCDAGVFGTVVSGLVLSQARLVCDAGVFGTVVTVC